MQIDVLINIPNKICITDISSEVLHKKQFFTTFSETKVGIKQFISRYIPYMYKILHNSTAASFILPGRKKKPSEISFHLYMYTT